MYIYIFIYFYIFYIYCIFAYFIKLFLRGSLTDRNNNEPKIHKITNKLQKRDDPGPKLLP